MLTRVCFFGRTRETRGVYNNILLIYLYAIYITHNYMIFKKEYFYKFSYLLITLLKNGRQAIIGSNAFYSARN